ncbi:MAG: hypothetical protein ACK4OG_06260, partial [Parvibaculum sp.]
LQLGHFALRVWDRIEDLGFIEESGRLRVRVLALRAITACPTGRAAPKPRIYKGKALYVKRRTAFPAMQGIDAHIKYA